MALVQLPSYLPFPDARTWGGSGTPAFFPLSLIDLAGERVTWVVRPTKAGNLRKVGFRTGAVTLAVALDIRVETVNVDGNATGTLWAANTSGTLLVPAANTWYWVTLTADATLVVGEDGGAPKVFAICIDFAGVGDLEIAGALSGMGRPGGIPYLNTRDIGSTWTRSNNVPNVGLEYSDGSRPWCDAVPILSGSLRAFNNGSTPDEVGLRFKYPFKCELAGAIVRVATASSSYVITLYDAADVVLKTITVDTDIQANTSSTQPDFYPFTGTLPVITAGAIYRLTVTPNSATNVTLAEYDIDSAGTMESHSGGVEIYRTERTNAGAWTDTTTARSMVIPLVASLDDGVPDGTVFLASRKRYNQISDPLVSWH